MGVDISGMVEIRPWPTFPDLPSEIPWEAAISLEHLNVTRTYDAFGCLFGVTNYAGFRPVAADRGLPDDMSAAARAVYDAGTTADPEAAGLWPTWITWDEIAGTDWDEPAERADTRLHEYERTEQGDWTFRRKAATSASLLQDLGLPIPTEGPQAATFPEGSTWTLDDVQYRAERLTRRDAVPANSPWQPVWQTMELLAGLHANQCRLVVWFDR